ncbi:MAG: DUF6100 family protein [Oscillospiraceae bacterium]
MKQECDHVRMLHEMGLHEMAFEAAFRLEELSEKTTLLTRALPAYTGFRLAQLGTERLIASSVPVEIGFTAENWFSVRMPVLLPKKEEGSAAYVRSFLYPAMQSFFSGVQPVRYRDCVLIYRHVYSAGRPERQYRDHDNIELNMVTDIVAMYVMTDDAPKGCCHYYCSAAASRERTEVYVVPKKEFPFWLVTEKTMPDEGVKLCETCMEQRQKHM